MTFSKPFMITALVLSLGAAAQAVAAEGPAAMAETPPEAPSMPAHLPATPAPADPAMADTTAAPAQTPSGALVGYRVISNDPIPDTPANRSKYGQPTSASGKRTQPAGN